MTKEYNNHEEVLNDIQIIIDKASRLGNYIDGIAFVLNANILVKPTVSGAGGDFDGKVVASLIGNFSETIQNTFGEETSPLYFSSMFRDPTLADKELQAWTIVFAFKNYRLVFAANLKRREKNLQFHQGAVPEYVNELLPLIKEYARLT